MAREHVFSTQGKQFSRLARIYIVIEQLTSCYIYCYRTTYWNYRLKVWICYWKDFGWLPWNLRFFSEQLFLNTLLHGCFFFTFSLRIIVILISIIWSFLVRHWNWEYLAFITVTSQQDLRSLHWFLSKINVHYIKIQRSQESLIEIKVFDRKTSFFAWHVLHCSTECNQSFFYLYYVTSCNKTATYFAFLFISRPHGPCSPSHVSSYLSFLNLFLQSKKGSRTVSLNICRVSSPFFRHRMLLEKW